MTNVDERFIRWWYRHGYGIEAIATMYARDPEEVALVVAWDQALSGLPTLRW